MAHPIFTLRGTNPTPMITSAVLDVKAQNKPLLTDKNIHREGEAQK